MREASSSPPDGVRALDGVAEALLASIAERVDLARTGDELAAVHRLRHDHVVAEGWASGERFPDGVERDAYDAHALQVAAWAGEELAGTIRLVPPHPDLRLPTEDAFDIEIEPRGEVVEIGRLLIAPAYRGDPAHRIWGALLARAWIEVRALGRQVMAGAAAPRLVELFRSQGLPFEIIGPAREHWGQSRHPIRLDPAGIAAGASWFGTGSVAGSAPSRVRATTPPG